MDVVLAKKDLLRLVARCQGVADRRNAMPALANILLAAEGDVLRVAATDLYLAMSGSTGAEVSRSGSVAVPARDLLERVKAMPEGPVQITTTDEAQTVIKAVGSPRRYTLHGIPGREFPTLPTPAADAQSMELPAKDVSLLIARTHFSISTDETRPHVNSAMFEWAGDRLRMVTTDGHRLSKMELRAPGKDAQATMLIPLKAIAELRRLADEATGDNQPTVTLSQTGPNAFFGIAGMSFAVKLVDAHFPPYQQVIPPISDRALRAPRAALAEALRAVSLAASDKTGGVKLTVLSGTLRITSESPESGNGFDEVPVDYEGPEITVGFNAKYFLDVLGAIEDDDVLLGVSGPLDPATIRPGKESSEHSYLAVVMPMRISSALVLERVVVKNLRNLERVELELEPGLTVAYGDNGQGKTSLLEAIYFVGSSRSFRTRRLGEVVQHGEKVASIVARFVERAESPLRREQTAAVEGTVARVRVDGNKPESLARYATLSPVVVFHAAELELSSGAAAGRRRLLDWLALFRDPASADHRARYERAIKARQEILRKTGPVVAGPAELDAFEKVAADHGAALTRARRLAAEALAPRVLTALRTLAAPGLTFQVVYRPGGSEAPQEGLEALQARRARDAGRPTASYGPHKDELELTIDGHPVRTDASQGQHRAMTLALKVAEAETVADARGLWPLLLLDDVSSELDRDRTEALLRVLQAAEGQMVVTTTRPELIRDALGPGTTPALVEVASGRCRRVA